MARRLPFLFLLAFASGCLSGWCGRSSRVGEYWPGEPAEVKSTPCEGTYALYGVPAALEPGATSPDSNLPRAQVRLFGGQPLGFEKAQDGGLWAIADKEKILLPDGVYWWEPGAQEAGAANRLGRQVEQCADRLFGPVDTVLRPFGWILRLAPLLKGR